MKNLYLKLILMILLVLIFVRPETIHAAGNGSIVVYPSTGNFKVGQSFTLDLKINGGGKEFNVAKANVTLTNLVVKNLVLGDCNFAFIKTPRTDDPSFIGGILGNSSKSCTVYTLTVVPIGVGTANLNLTNLSIIEFKTISELFLTVINGSYVASASDSNIPTIMSPTSIPWPSKSNNNFPNQNQNNYDVSIQVSDSFGSPIPNIEVSFNSGQKDITNTEGIASFTNIDQGIYQIDVISKNKKSPSTVINVSGINHQIVLGIREQKAKTNIWIWIILILAVVLLVPISIVIYKKYIASKINN